MQKLLRKNILRPALSSVRGGHGWDAPHPPVPSAYDHKRIVSLFHFFCWNMCLLHVLLEMFDIFVVLNIDKHLRYVFGFSMIRQFFLVFWRFFKGTSHDDGTMHLNYDIVNRSNLILKRTLAPDEERKQVNIEAKNCIDKLEQEIRKKYA